MKIRSLSVALAFLRIPRLFFSLLCIPIILAVLILIIQLLSTLVVVGMINPVNTSTTAAVDEKTATRPNIGRLILYHSSTRLEKMQVCRWVQREVNGVQKEVPPTQDCKPSSLDVAIQTENPATFDPAEFLEVFNGNTHRLHICKTCTPDVVMEKVAGQIKTHVLSVWGMVLVGLANSSATIEDQRSLMMESKARVSSKLGEIIFHSPGIIEPVSFNTIVQRLGLVGNVGGIVIVALWLAIKAHKKILDLFAKSGALLPLVAGLGKSEFYGSLWWITFFRVAGFILGAIPLTFMAFNLLDEQGLSLQMKTSYLMLWIVALVTSFSFAAVLTSIADLKERQGLGSLIYLWAPLFICAVTFLVWGATFVFDSPTMGIVRSIIAATPIIGMGPLLLAPVLPPHELVLVVHGILAASAIRYASIRNAKWLAAHLEEI